MFSFYGVSTFTNNDKKAALEWLSGLTFNDVIRSVGKEEPSLKASFSCHDGA